MSRIATVFGGSGFVGRYITQRLAKSGWRVRVAVRRPNEAHFVRPYGVPGQVEPVLANIRNEASVAAAVRGTNAVINCVGILLETSKQKFNDLHHEAAGRIARLATESNAERLIQISSIGANPSSDSRYAQSKGKGEIAVVEAFPSAVILRPSVVFGQEDQFFNKFAAMTRFSPVVPTVSGKTLFQPVYVGDVAAATIRAVEDTSVVGVFELGGPEIMSFRELMQRMLEVIRKRRLVLDAPLPIARIMAGALDVAQFVSGGLLLNSVITRDQIKQLTRNNVVASDAQTLQDLGISAVAMEAILETYLYRFRPVGQYTAIHESSSIVQEDKLRR